MVGERIKILSRGGPRSRSSTRTLSILNGVYKRESLIVYGD